MARTTSTRVEGGCVSARRRGRGSSDIRRERSARPPKEAFTRKKGGADERVTRTGTESGVSYVINLGHRHGPCIAHLVPLNVLWAHGPRSVSYATLLSQIGSAVFASSKKNSCCADLPLDPISAALALRAVLLQAGKSKPFSSADERVAEPFSVARAEKSGRVRKIHEHSMWATGFVRRCLVRTAKAAVLLRLRGAAPFPTC